MKKLSRMVLIALLSAMVALGLAGSEASAHERRSVSGYDVVVGWIVEPALEGQKNGVDLRVTNADTEQPVEGVEQTVQVELTHVASGVSKLFALRTIFRDPGHYTADLILTAPGVYRMRFSGAIESTPVDETFNSRGGGGDFGDVESTADIQFPIQVAEVREIEAVVRHVEEENHAIEASAAKAGTMAIAGIVVGALGITAGGVSLAASRWKAK